MHPFALPAELEELRASVRRLAETEIAGHAAEADEQEEYPWASWRAWHDAGFAGLPFPEEYGGQGGGILAHAICVEEVARVCASSSLFTFISKLGTTALLDHGSDESDLIDHAMIAGPDAWTPHDGGSAHGCA